MALLFLYLLKSSISLAILVGFYEVIQKREVFFNFNRAYLLLGIAIALILPFLNFNIFNLVIPETDSQNYLLTYQVTSFQLAEVTIGSESSTQESFSWVLVLFYIYLSGVVLRTALVIARGMQLIGMTKKTRSSINDRVRIILTKGDLPVFSFFNNIFIAENTFKSNDAEHIIAHEKVHISQLHSMDLLFAELICIVQWFNPFAYTLKKAIRENHEFLADQQVISNYSDPSNYRLLLLKHSSMIKTNSLAHNFSYLLLKRRLLMTTKPKRKMRFGISLIGSSLALTLVLFACSQSDQHLTETNAMDDISVNDDVYQNVEIMPEYPGGMDSLFAFLGANINYPKEAKDNGVEGKVMVNFIIDEDGSVIRSKATNGIGYGCDEEAVRVVSSMPNWKPGVNDGKPVKVEFNLPISFKLGEAGINTTRTMVIDDTDSVFKVVDQMPVFPGGTKALMQYLGANIKYPVQAKRDSIQGRVFVSFLVEKDGTVTSSKVLRGIGGGCDEEALRVISTMPAWEPGRDENGEAVRVAYNIPIKYALN